MKRGSSDYTRAPARRPSHGSIASLLLADMLKTRRMEWTLDEVLKITGQSKAEALEYFGRRIYHSKRPFVVYHPGMKKAWWNGA